MLKIKIQRVEPEKGGKRDYYEKWKKNAKKG